MISGARDFKGAILAYRRGRPAEYQASTTRKQYAYEGARTMGEVAYLVINWEYKEVSRATAKVMAFHHLDEGCGARWLAWRVDQIELVGDFCSTGTGDMIQLICPGCGALCEVSEPTYASGIGKVLPSDGVGGER